MTSWAPIGSGILTLELVSLRQMQPSLYLRTPPLFLLVFFFFLVFYIQLSSFLCVVASNSSLDSLLLFLLYSLVLAFLFFYLCCRLSGEVLGKSLLISVIGQETTVSWFEGSKYSSVDVFEMLPHPLFLCDCQCLQ